uniref:Nuclear cap-binding protein subunit 1 n=1 Tax=Strongyloides venezuelensis TaxID=75913 RepID=A0A0K0F7J2_STRVS
MANRKRQFTRIENDSDVSMELDEKRRNGPEVFDGPRIVRMIVLMGNTQTGNLESNLENLANICINNIEDFRFQILDTLGECAVYTSYKHSIYSPIIGLLNVKVSEVVKEYLDNMIKDIDGFLFNGQFQYALNILLMLAELINVHVVSPKSFLNTLQHYIAEARNSDDRNRSDYCIFSVMHCLPICALELSDNEPALFMDLISHIEDYMRNRDTSFIDCLKIWESSEVINQKEKLQSLWDQIKNLENRHWRDEGFTRQYFSNFRDEFETSTLHELNSITIPESSQKRVYPTPQIVFRLFEPAHISSNDPPLPRVETIDRFLLEQALIAILEQHVYDRKACAESMLSYIKKVDYPVTYVIVEIIFRLLLTLPESPQIHVFYGSLFIECCKLQPNKMPQVLALAAELIFRNMNEMQVACVDRLIDWFSYHLSNFQYRWTWSDWFDQVNCDSNSMKKYFLTEVIIKCVQFGYYARIVEALPEGCQLMPPPPEFNNVLKDSDDSTYKLSQDLAESLSKRITNDELLAYLAKSSDNGDAMDDGQLRLLPSYDKEKIKLLMATLLDLAQNAYTHNVTFFLRYRPAFLEIVKQDSSIREIILESIFTAWKYNPQLIELLTDKLLKMQILDTYSIVKYILESRDLGDYVDKKYFYHVLYQSVHRLSTHANNLFNDYEKLKSQIKSVERKFVKKEEDSNMEECSTTNLEDEIDIDSLGNYDEWLINQKKNLEEKERCMFESSNALKDILERIFTFYFSKVISIDREHEEIFYNFVNGRLKQFVIVNLKTLIKYKDSIVNIIESTENIGEDLHKDITSLLTIK